MDQGSGLKRSRWDVRKSEDGVDNDHEEQGRVSGIAKIRNCETNKQSCVAQVDNQEKGEVVSTEMKDTTLEMVGGTSESGNGAALETQNNSIEAAQPTETPPNSPIEHEDPTKGAVETVASTDGGVVDDVDKTTEMNVQGEPGTVPTGTNNMSEDFVKIEPGTVPGGNGAAAVTGTNNTSEDIVKIEPGTVPGGSGKRIEGESGSGGCYSIDLTEEDEQQMLLGMVAWEQAQEALRVPSPPTTKKRGGTLMPAWWCNALEQARMSAKRAAEGKRVVEPLSQGVALFVQQHGAFVSTANLLLLSPFPSVFGSINDLKSQFDAVKVVKEGLVKAALEVSHTQQGVLSAWQECEKHIVDLKNNMYDSGGVPSQKDWMGFKATAQQCKKKLSCFAECVAQHAAKKQEYQDLLVSFQHQLAEVVKVAAGGGWDCKPQLLATKVTVNQLGASMVQMQTEENCCNKWGTSVLACFNQLYSALIAAS